MQSNRYFFISLIILITLCHSCNSVNQVDKLEIEKITIDSSDPDFGYYYSVEPIGEIKAVLVLLPGFSQKSEDIFTNSEIHEEAYKRNILTIGFSGINNLTADSTLQLKISNVLSHVLENTDIGNDQFVIGGYSAGGVIALRYTELCHQFPDRFPILPKGVFMVDAPIDLYHLWKYQEENIINNTSSVAINEARFVGQYFKDKFGATPSENPNLYRSLSPFSINKEWGNNERYLENVAVRAYHDVDIAWRLTNRNQSAGFGNYIPTSELINRLIMMGNAKAEFIQTFKTGYRKNGERHPHSWSIVDEKECVQWIRRVIQ